MNKIGSKKQLNLGIVMQSPDLGGAETYMLSLVENFLKADSKVFIASNKGKFFDRAKKFPVKTTEIPFIFDIIGNYRGLIKSILFLPYALLFYSKLLRTYKKNHVGVILMSGYSEKLLVTWIASFFDIPVVWIEYGPLQTVFNKLMKFPKVAYRLTKHLPAAVIVPTRNTQQSLITDARVSLAKLHIIPCGTKVVNKQKSTKKALIPEWSNCIVIGNISRQTREKGQDILIKAMPYVIKKAPLARLLIVGDGPDLNYYRQLVTNLGLEKYVYFTGFVKDTQRYYDSMDLFVFPTVWDMEGFGVVLIEAMMHRLPTVGSEMGPVPEIIDDQKSGLLFKTGDEKELAKAVISLYKDSKKRELFAENGYKKALKNYNIVTISKRIIGILTDATYTNVT
ncbi:MAG TPA: glycosyltransferase family 4 protein [Candidatus Acidoferrales bacterium]|nr:glycosyltransferase family 4 protein [Candidatus Acidoferrales bacterium]